MMNLLTGGYAKLIIAALVIAAIGFTVIMIDRNGYNRAETKWSAKYAKRESDLIEASDKELNRQLAANNAAKKAEAERISIIRAQNQALEIRIKELEDEAALDPDADRIALSPAAGVRINRVR